MTQARKVGVFTVLAVLGGGAILLLNTRLQIAPRPLSRTRLICTKARINTYYEKHHKLPAALEDLPPREGYDNEIVDAWGTFIEYTARGGEVALRSFGADRKPGGTERDADIELTFRPCEPASAPAGSQPAE